MRKVHLISCVVALAACSDRRVAVDGSSPDIGVDASQPDLLADMAADLPQDLPQDLPVDLLPDLPPLPDAIEPVSTCEQAAALRSYVGCEFWAVDLDNVVVSIGSAAAQQFAVVLSNPSVQAAEVEVWIDEAAPGSPSAPNLLAQRTIPPGAIETIDLPAREVDGSPPGTFNSGTGSALSRHGFKITSSVPIIAYQFNPLDNGMVFSNDASLLIPATALTDSAGQGAPYVVLGYPQTIAITADPETNYGENMPAFLTIAATRPATQVTIKLSTRILGDWGLIPAANPGDTLTFTLEPFDVLNLETNDFGADFTGTRISASAPVVVFAGSESSDVPPPTTLADRKCCADHLEQQLLPTPTLGKTFIAVTTPPRFAALNEAGASLQPQQQKDYFKLLSGGGPAKVTVSTSDGDTVYPVGNETSCMVDADEDLIIQSDEPLIVGQFLAGQQDTGIEAGLPGGDPSFVLVPSIDQHRKNVPFLTPDSYAFDYILVAAPAGTTISLDGRLLVEGCDEGAPSRICCARATIGGSTGIAQYETYKCQLSFPELDLDKLAPNNILPGSQNDGAHRLEASHPIGVVVYGFDNYVSYAYPAGLQLELVNP